MLHLHTILEYRVYEYDTGSYYIVKLCQPPEYTDVVVRDLTESDANIQCALLNSQLRT